MLSLNTTGTNIRVIHNPGASGYVLPAALINSYSALAIPAYKRAIAFLTNNLASFPRSVRKDGAKMNPSHPLDVLLRRRPNGVQNAFVFWRTLWFHATHTSNGYARINRDAKTFRPVAFHNLLPEDVVPFRWTAEEGDEPQQFYYHRPTKTALPGVDVIHLQELSHDGMAGIDPVAMHEGTFQRAATLERYQVEYLRKGTIIRGAVEVPDAMTPDQIAEMRGILSTFQGPDGENDILILSGGGKLNNATTNAQQSQLVEQEAHSTKQIAQMTGVPPVFLYELSEEKYRNTVEQDGLNVVRFTFRPWIEMAEAELTSKLLTEDEQDGGHAVKLNPDALLRGDTTTQVNTVATTVRDGLRTPNEGREVLGIEKSTDPEADKLKRSGDTAPKPAADAKPVEPEK